MKVSWNINYRRDVPRQSLASVRLNSVSEGLVPLMFSTSWVYSLKDCDPVGLSVSRSVDSVGLKWTVLIGRTGFVTMYWIPDPTLNLKWLKKDFWSTNADHVSA